MNKEQNVPDRRGRTAPDAAAGVRLPNPRPQVTGNARGQNVDIWSLHAGGRRLSSWAFGSTLGQILGLGQLAESSSNASCIQVHIRCGGCGGDRIDRVAPKGPNYQPIGRTGMKSRWHVAYRRSGSSSTMRPVASLPQ